MSPRVALIGNMNNASFSLARHLRDRGIDAHVLLFNSEFAHFHPSTDTYDTSYREYVFQLHWGSPIQFPLVSASKIRRDLASYEVLIGCGAAPAHLERAGRDLDVFVPFGGDIWTMLGKSDGNPLRFAKYLPIMRAQARGIGRARVFHMAPTNPLYEGQWTRYRGRSQRWYEPVPLIYDGEYRAGDFSELVSRSVWAREFQRLREESDLLLFSAARHFWRCAPQHPAAKGTHRLLRAVAQLQQRHPNVRVSLITFEYGKDVPASKRLAQQLGIDQAVRWFPQLPRRDLMVALALADVACAEFENSWVASGVLYEALAMSRPVLAHRNDSLYQNQDLYPILNAKEPDEIADCLEGVLVNKQATANLGALGHAWYRKWVVEAPLARYEALIRGEDR